MIQPRQVNRQPGLTPNRQMRMLQEELEIVGPKRHGNRRLVIGMRVSRPAVAVGVLRGRILGRRSGTTPQQECYEEKETRGILFHGLMSRSGTPTAASS